MIHTQKHHLEHKYEQGLNFIKFLIKKKDVDGQQVFDDFKDRNKRVQLLGKRSRKELESHLE